MITPENLLLIDIETVPGCRSLEELPERMQRLWARKSALIDKDNPSFEQTYAQRAGIYAEFGKIICIGLGYFIRNGADYQLKVKMLSGHDETEMLKEFSAICNKFFSYPERQFCGHNIREFDIPYICRRSFIRGVPLPEVLSDLQNKKPWENPMLDTLQYWKFGEYKNFTSVDLLSAVLDIESPKGDIDGSDVAGVYWKDNALDRIVSYCGRDVVTVAQVLMRLNGMKLIDEQSIIFAD
ncbi:MAG: ribonuclease H-like domain-containing protein [Chitinophagaceae bacterium]|nr:ribonuclease H-like domain-containing protein [Chitinophagaceae bacterium]